MIKKLYELFFNKCIFCLKFEVIIFNFKFVIFIDNLWIKWGKNWVMSECDIVNLMVNLLCFIFFFKYFIVVVSWFCIFFVEVSKICFVFVKLIFLLYFFKIWKFNEFLIFWILCVKVDCVICCRVVVWDIDFFCFNVSKFLIYWIFKVIIYFLFIFWLIIIYYVKNVCSNIFLY